MKAWENMLENIEMHHQTNPAQSPARLDGIRVICGCDKSVQTSSDVSAQLLIALTCFKKNFYCRVIMGGGYWWSINQAVDTLINRYIIEFGRLESWLKPDSRFTQLQVFVDCENTIKNPSNIHFMDEKVISQWCHDPITNSLFLHDWVPFYMPPKQSELDVMCECLLVLCFTKERNVDPSTSETSVLTVWHFIFSNWCCNWTVGLV